jgi:hypothetical protein
MCDVKINSKQLEEVHLLIKLSQDGNELFVFENNAESGVRIVSQSERLFLKKQVT